jgi:hypothetical protein
LTAETSRAVIKILDYRVEYRNIQPPNILWNPEIRNIVLVNFEHLEILKHMEVF